MMLLVDGLSYVHVGTDRGGSYILQTSVWRGTREWRQASGARLQGWKRRRRGFQGRRL